MPSSAEALGLADSAVEEPALEVTEAEAPRVEEPAASSKVERPFAPEEPKRLAHQRRQGPKLTGQRRLGRQPWVGS